MRSAFIAFVSSRFVPDPQIMLGPRTMVLQSQIAQREKKGSSVSPSHDGLPAALPKRSRWLRERRPSFARKNCIHSSQIDSWDAVRGAVNPLTLIVGDRLADAVLWAEVLNIGYNDRHPKCNFHTDKARALAWTSRPSLCFQPRGRERRADKLSCRHARRCGRCWG
jgi:hypothetical protein